MDGDEHSPRLAAAGRYDRTGDIAGSERDAVKAAGKLVGTKAMGQLVVERI